MKKGQDGQDKIWLPSSLRKILPEWYHGTLKHPGARRLEEIVRENFTCPGIGILCKEIKVTCETCSKMKLTNVVKDGKLPLRNDKVIKPWELLLVDLCRPWKIKCEFEEAEEGLSIQSKIAQIWALMMIDEGSSWPEIAAINNKNAEEIATLVDDTWFVRYPRPLYCIHDDGGEFIESGFQELLDSYGVKAKPTTIKNT